MATLVAVVDAGSFSGAGRALRMPLATVSRKVSDLERHLGAQLLQRSTRQLTLTDAGRAYVEACKQILERVAEAERHAAGEYSAPKGGLVISAPSALGRIHVAPVVNAFLQAQPEIDVRLVLSDRVMSLLEDHVDVAVRVGALPDSSLISRKVGAVSQVVCGSPTYFAKRRAPKKPEDLTAHDCITFEGIAAPDVWIFRKAKAALSVPIHSRLAVNTADAAIEAVVAGLGITRVLSYQAAASSSDLVRVLKKFEPEPTPVNLVYAGQPMLPQKLRAFLDFAVPRLQARLPADPR